MLNITNIQILTAKLSKYVRDDHSEAKEDLRVQLFDAIREVIRVNNMTYAKAMTDPAYKPIVDAMDVLMGSGYEKEEYDIWLKGEHYYRHKGDKKSTDTDEKKQTDGLAALQKKLPKGQRRVDTTAKNRVYGSLLISIGFDIERYAEYNPESRIGELYKELTKTAPIEGKAEPAVKEDFVDLPIDTDKEELRKGFSIVADKNGKYNFHGPDGRYTSKAKAVKKKRVSKKKQLADKNKVKLKTRRVATTAKDRISGSLLSSVGFDLERYAEYNPDSYFGKMYDRLNKTEKYNPETGEVVPSDDQTPDKKVVETKEQAKKTKTTNVAFDSNQKKPAPKKRRYQTTAKERVYGSLLKSIGFDMERYAEFNPESDIAKLHEKLTGFEDGKATGKILEEINKPELIAISKSIDKAIEAFNQIGNFNKSIADVEKQTAIIRERKQGQAELLGTGFEGNTPDFFNVSAKSQPTEEAPSGPSPTDVLMQVLPGITKQILELTDALKKQSGVLSAADQKAQQTHHEEETKPSKPSIVAMVAPKAKTAAKVAAVAGAATVGAMALKATAPTEAQTSSYWDNVSSWFSNAAGTVGNALSNISDSLFGLKPAGNSAHAGQAMAYFMSQGWTKQQAAAIVGTMQQESGGGLDPNAFNGGGGGHGAVGIAQWRGPRQNGNFPKQALGVDTLRGTSFEQQLQYVQWELTHNYKHVADRLRQAQSTEDAVAAFVAGYEGVAGDHLAQRTVNAKALAGEPIQDNSVVGRVESAFSSAYGGVMSLFKPDLVTIRTRSGKTAEVAKEFAPNFQGFVNDLESIGYKITSIGGYADRANVNNPSVKSYHALGASIDINPASNPNNSNRTDLPQQTSALARKWGLGWGMEWRTVKDPMHFSIARSEGGSVDITRSGYMAGEGQGIPSDSGRPKPAPKPVDASMNWTPGNGSLLLTANARAAMMKAQTGKPKVIVVPTPSPAQAALYRTGSNNGTKAPPSGLQMSPGDRIRAHYGM